MTDKSPTAQNAPATAVILAAGLGNRMRSALPKGLQPLGGKSMLQHLLSTLEAVEYPLDIQVVAAEDNLQLLQEAAGDKADDIHWTVQVERLGTGHAVRCALEDGPKRTGPVMVLFADVPLIRAATIDTLLTDYWKPGGVALLSMELEKPSGYGRIMRDNAGSVLGVVEQTDASPAQAQIREVNTGVLVADAERLLPWLKTGRKHRSGEYYLPDIIALAKLEEAPVAALKLDDPREAFGANNKSQLHQLERYWQTVQAEQLMLEGVWIADASRLDIRGDVEIGRDAFLDVGVVLEGQVRIGADVRIGPYCVIRDSVLGDGVEVRAWTSIEQAEVGDGATVGPYARLRPGTRLGAGAKVGNFVEVKNAELGAGAKASHLAYIGDAEVGDDTNIGAGVITCNYDGKDKHRTEIGSGAFIGSNSSLVAPVSVADKARVGAGSVITKNVNEGELAVTRAEQRNLGRKKPAGKG